MTRYVDGDKDNGEAGNLQPVSYEQAVANADYVVDWVSTKSRVVLSEELVEFVERNRKELAKLYDGRAVISGEEGQKMLE